MKMNACILIGALAIAPLALAKLSTTPQSLGQVEGTLDFCSKLNPKSEVRYKEWGKMFVKDATAEELKKARSSNEYKEAYDSISEQLDKVSKEKAAEACTSLVGKE